MGFISSLNQRYDIIICVYWFELFSQVSDVAHEPLVKLSCHHVAFLRISIIIVGEDKQKKEGNSFSIF